jgi:DNA-3-methyladenine glycosylase I
MAGAFSIDGLGAPFVDSIDGDWGTVVGLSLPLLRRMLAAAGVAVTGLWPRPAGPLVRDLTDEDRDWLAGVVTAAWGLPVVSLSGAHDVVRLPGLVAQEEPGGARLGVLTYRVEGPGLEVVTLNSLAEGRGIGTALLAGARQRARQDGQRLWLTTGNDNVRAIGFYQRRGMDMVALHRDFADEVRKVKPWLPEEPAGGITFRHAIELEYPVRVGRDRSVTGAHREDSTSAIFAAAAEGSSASCSSSPQDQR